MDGFHNVVVDALNYKIGHVSGQTAAPAAPLLVKLITCHSDRSEQ